MIDYFDGTEYDFLSNFYAHPVLYNGKMWRTTEHAYQAAKTISPGMQNRIHRAISPGLAKKLGQMVELRKDWEEVKDNIMLDLLRIKFIAGSPLSLRLLATAPQELMEGNHWHDNYWGHCLCKGCRAKKIVGKNMLGKMLMQVRDELTA